MNKKLVLVLPIFLCLALTALDIFVVEIFYRPTASWENIWKYWYVYWGLIFILPIVLMAKTKTFYPIMTYIFFQFGLEDTAFYGFQGYLPETYWGVSILTVFEPAKNLVLQMNVAGIIFIIFFYGIMIKINFWDMLGRFYIVKVKGEIKT